MTENSPFCNITIINDEGKNQQWMLSTVSGNRTLTQTPKYLTEGYFLIIKGEKKISVKWRNLAVQTSDQSQTPNNNGTE